MKIKLADHLSFDTHVGKLCFQPGRVYNTASIDLADPTIQDAIIRGLLVMIHDRQDQPIPAESPTIQSNPPPTPTSEPTTSDVTTTQVDSTSSPKQIRKKGKTN